MRKNVVHANVIQKFNFRLIPVMGYMAQSIISFLKLRIQKRHCVSLYICDYEQRLLSSVHNHIYICAICGKRLFYMDFT